MNVKLTPAKSAARTANNSFRRSFYVRKRKKLLQSPDAILLAPTDRLSEASVLGANVDLFETTDVFFDPVTNNSPT